MSNVRHIWFLSPLLPSTSEESEVTSRRELCAIALGWFRTRPGRSVTVLSDPCRPFLPTFRLARSMEFGLHRPVGALH
jgi:hypothetical protein